MSVSKACLISIAGVKKNLQWPFTRSQQDLGNTHFRNETKYLENIFKDISHHQLFPLLAASILSFRKENLLRVMKRIYKLNTYITFSGNLNIFYVQNPPGYVFLCIFIIKHIEKLSLYLKDRHFLAWLAKFSCLCRQ